MGRFNTIDLGDVFASEPAYLVYGAILAGIVGLITQHLGQKNEARARRRALFRVLSDQLHELTLETPAFDPDTKLIRRPVVISAVGDLLQSGVLEDPDHGELVYELVQWKALEAMFNEQIRIAAAVYWQGWVTSGHVKTREAVHNSLNAVAAKLREHRARLLDALPVEYRQPRISKPEDIIAEQPPDIEPAPEAADPEVSPAID